MTTQTLTSEHSQRGITIISLLVGLVISMLCILASLSLYKNLIFVAAESKVDAMHDGQVSSALLTLQKEVSSAGYGIDGADADDIKVRRVAASAPNPGTIELLWRYTSGGVTVCRGVMETAETRVAGGTSYRTLNIRTATAGCDQTVDLTTLNWTTVTTIGQWPVIGGLATHITNNQTLFNFVVSEQVCSPYGAGDQSTHLNVFVSTPTSAKLNGGNTVAATTYNYCLPNTYPTI